MKSMKMDNFMKMVYVGLDIHGSYITGTAMRKDGIVKFGGNFPNTKETERYK